MRISTDFQRQAIISQAAGIGLYNPLTNVLSEPDEIDSL